MKILAFVLSLTMFGAAAAAAAPVDAPELAAPGPHAVGVRRLTVDVGSVVDVDAAAKGQADAPAQARALPALLWYPASGAPKPGLLERELKNHPWRGWGQATVRMGSPSQATPEAPPAPGGRLPVVVLSHGLLNWAETLGYLAEHLASRGYVVLGIQHDDERHAEPLRAALALRTLDQLAAIKTLIALDAQAGDPLQGRLQTQRLAVIGYSMGGYGALLSAGARVSTEGMAFNYATPTAMARHTQAPSEADQALQARIGAVVAFAPWGLQKALLAIQHASLAAIKVPVLAVVGDQDDVSGYADGVRGGWEAMSGAPRWLLTYENARHNIARSGLPQGAPSGFREWEAFEEPVWRRDRLMDINCHFVTAFLDSQLRGDASRERWLKLATERAAEGQWPQPPGTPVTGQFAGEPKGALTHWAGFQRRWALGMKLEKREPAVKP